MEIDHSVVPHAILRLKIINPKKIISVFKEGRYGVKGLDLELYDYYTEKFQNSHIRDIWLNTLSPFGVLPKSRKYIKPLSIQSKLILSCLKFPNPSFLKI